jgi:predicted aminopeptidase
MLQQIEVGWIKRSGSTMCAIGGSAALDPPYGRSVIPAKAGIQFLRRPMDSRLRGNDTSGDFVPSFRLYFSLALLAFSLTGCSTLSFYWQALNGQMEILNKARPIESVIQDRDTKPELKQRLTSLLAIREYASKELKLPDNKSYRSYADLKRPFVIWNVFATTEFSTELTQWCFPIAGCVNYRGYFSKENAEQFAKNLSSEMNDSFIAGVPAYSTLGYFNDPMLNTFIHYPEVELARLVFHELAHQVVYVQDDSMFNESFATAVEEAGIERWLESQAGRGLSATWQTAQTRRAEFQQLVLKYQQRLKGLYATDLSNEAKRLAKQQTFRELREEYQSLKTSWGGYAGYDRWFGQELNNAHLASIAIYNELVPAFRKLLQQEQGDFVRFYDAVKRLTKQSKDARAVFFQSLG